MAHERSCGAVLYRVRQKTEFLIIKHKAEHGNHWDFPKGHIEQGETEEETATREVYEETGQRFRFVPDAKAEITYPLPNGNTKTVTFFLGEAEDAPVQYIFDELDDHAWLAYDEAMRKLTHENSRKVLSLLAVHVPR